MAIEIHQVDAFASRRGGSVDVELRGERVTLRGRAVSVLRGSLLA